MGISLGQMSIWLVLMWSMWSIRTMWSTTSFRVVGRYSPVSRSYMLMAVDSPEKTRVSGLISRSKDGSQPHMTNSRGAFFRYASATWGGNFTIFVASSTVQPISRRMPLIFFTTTRIPTSESSRRDCPSMVRISLSLKTWYLLPFIRAPGMLDCTRAVDAHPAVGPRPPSELALINFLVALKKSNQ